MLLFRVRVFTFGCFVLALAAGLSGCNANGKGALFSLMPASHTGIVFQQHLQTSPNDITGIGSGGNGLAVGDINNDGLPDIIFTGGTEAPAVYLNKGHLQFEDITAQTGIHDNKGRGSTTGMCMADVNGDGLLDVYILKAGIESNAAGTVFSDYGSNLLFINQGDLSFKEQGKQMGLDLIGTSMAANFFDYDNDGDLDVYIVNYPERGRNFDLEFYKQPPSSKWYNDMLLEQVDGRFVDVTKKAGILWERNLGQSVSVADINNDGWLDIFVANDFFGRDFLYINNENKGFEEQARAYFKVSALSAMGSDFADVNRDGHMDLFVGEMMPEGNYRQKLNLTPFSLEIYNQLETARTSQYTRNMLYANRGTRFDEVGLFAGVEATEWSWGSTFADLDNDGLSDLFVANGIKRDMTNMDFIRNQYGSDVAKSSDPSHPLSLSAIQAIPSVVTPNCAFKNLGDFAFQKMGDKWGLNTAVHSRAAIYADLDNDGDLDIILNNIDTIPFIYQNNTERKGKGHYLKIRLQGQGKNTFGLGARVWVYTGAVTQVKELSSSKGFSSSPEPILHFGLDTVMAIDSIKVKWLSGKVQVLRSVEADQQLRIFEKDAGPEGYPSHYNPNHFIDHIAFIASHGFRHRELPFNDFKNFRIHHRKISAEGPPLVVGDVNNDGLDDFFIGGASGSVGALYIQQVGRSFMKAYNQPWEANPGHEDVGALFFDADNDGHLDLLICSGSLEFEEGSPNLQDQLYLNNGDGTFRHSPNALPEMLTSSACAVAVDFDHDGDLDLFIGGRVSQKGYPAAPRSYLLQNDIGRFTDVTDSVAPELARIGMVTSALWTDYDSDGFTDLMVVGEWMPVTVFKNQGGQQLRRINASGLENTHGWWNSITGADMDNDGDIDYIAGNLGENTFFKASGNAPVLLYANDFDGNGTVDPVVFRNVDGKEVPFVNRDLLCSQMPVLNNQYYTFAQYAKATLDNMFDDTLKQSSTVYKATEMRSSYIENLGNGSFKVSPLPPAAQLAPTYGIQCIDLNKDGNLDILLAGNSGANHFECGPTFGHMGVVLTGNGKGQWKALGRTGFFVPNETKALSKLFSNIGLSYHLLASVTNEGLQLFAIRKDRDEKTRYVHLEHDDVYMMVEFGNGTKRKVELYYGHGYASQDSRVFIADFSVKGIEVFKMDGTSRFITNFEVQGVTSAY